MSCWKGICSWNEAYKYATIEQSHSWNIYAKESNVLNGTVCSTRELGGNIGLHHHASEDKISWMLTVEIKQQLQIMYEKQHEFIANGAK